MVDRCHCGWVRAFGWWARFALCDAHRGTTHKQSSGQLPDCFRVAVLGHCDVLFNKAHRSANQLHCRNLAAHRPSCRLGFLFVPISLVAYVGVPSEKNNAVAGLINFMRNMGSSVGTSMVTTLIARRSQFHQEILGDYVRLESSNFQSGQRLGSASREFRVQCARRAETGLFQDLSARSGAGRDLGLRGYVHGLGGRFGHHVLSCVCFKEQRSGRRW